MIVDDVISVVSECLQIDANTLSPASGLLGVIPEFDSMAVVTVLTSLEENFGIFVEDDEISAETFESIQTLADFVQSKL